MNLSLGEFSALVAKAFRGAGCSWGMTEEASFSARRLAEFGFPAGEIIVRLLGSISGAAPGSLMPRADWQAPSDALCAVCVGTSIGDQAGCGDLVLDPTHEPALLAPLLMETLSPKSPTGYVLEWDGGGCEVTATAITAVGELPVGAVAVRISRRELDAVYPVTATRVGLDAETMAALEGFAHNIYAPATEASRNAGAGGADD